MANDVMRDITNSFNAEIQAELGTGYKKLAYVEDVAKNSFRTNTDRYGTRALAVNQLPGVTKFVTLQQDFEVVLTRGYVESSISDDSQVDDALDLRAELLDVYKRLVNNRGGLPNTIILITDLAVGEPEYLEDDKVVIIRASMQVQYRYSL